MAATKRNAMLIEEARNKIRTTQLINRLHNHIDGTVDLSTTQITAISILLKKSLPDLAAITLAADPKNPPKFVLTWDTSAPAAKPVED